MQCLPMPDVVHSMSLSCVILFYITMNILPDVSYKVQGTALPFEHLLTSKILDGSRSTYSRGLELVKKIKSN